MGMEKFMAGPIPGEHLTQDSKAKPWKNPPTYVEFDDAFDYVIDSVISHKNFLPPLIVLAENNIALTSIVTTIMMKEVGKGSFTPDIALMMAGPVYKLIGRILDEFGISYLTGFETAAELAGKINNEAPTKPKKLTKAQEEEIARMAEEAKDEAIPEGGLMGAPVEGEEVEIPMEGAEEEPMGEGLVPAPTEQEEPM